MLTDGGIETTLIFHDGHRAARFRRLRPSGDETGAAALRDYFAHLRARPRDGVGLILESATWRANARLGATSSATRRGAGRREPRGHRTQADARARETRRGSGAGGDQRLRRSARRRLRAGRDDDRRGGARPTTPADRDLRGTGADLVTAITMNYVEEAIGITRAAAARTACPSSSRSPSRPTAGCRAGRRSARRSSRSTSDRRGPAYYMINCAHPTHFEGVLAAGEPWAGASAASGPTRPARATRSSTRPGARRGGPRGARRPHTDCGTGARAHRPRRLLRHRSSPHRRHRERLVRGGLAAEAELRRPARARSDLLAGGGAGARTPARLPAARRAHPRRRVHRRRRLHRAVDRDRAARARDPSLRRRAAGGRDLRRRRVGAQRRLGDRLVGRAPGLVDAHGAEQGSGWRAEVAAAVERIGAFAAEHDIDCHCRNAGYLLDRAGACPSRRWEAIVGRMPGHGAGERRRGARRASSPAHRLAAAPGRAAHPGHGDVQPALLARGLRRWRWSGACASTRPRRWSAWSARGCPRSSRPAGA